MVPRGDARQDKDPGADDGAQGQEVEVGSAQDSRELPSAHGRGGLLLWCFFEEGSAADAALE